MCCSLRDHFQSTVCKRADLIHFERLDRRSSFLFLFPFDHIHMFFQPAGVFTDKGFNFCQGSTVGGTDNDLSVVSDLQRQCAPFAADDLDGIRKRIAGVQFRELLSYVNEKQAAENENRFPAACIVQANSKTILCAIVCPLTSNLSNRLAIFNSDSAEQSINTCHDQYTS